MNERIKEFAESGIKHLMAKNTTESWAEAICIAIGMLKDKDGKLLRVFLSDDYCAIVTGAQARGHWRTYPSGKRGWVKDYWRGGASKGTVFKDYQLKENT